MSQWIDNSTDPQAVFNQWYSLAVEANTFEPTKVTLATQGVDGFPSARVVLLKIHDASGFCFFTNYGSRKGLELKANNKAGLVFHWEKPVHRQVRVQGLVEKLTYEESNAYFQSRGRGSQIGAWASPQSSEISDRQVLEKKVQELEKKFEGQEIPCPENWGGYRLKPLVLEFWQAGDNRLHDRRRFVRSDFNEAWRSLRLAP